MGMCGYYDETAGISTLGAASLSRIETAGFFLHVISARIAAVALR